MWSIFPKLKKLPKDNLEIHVVSTFPPCRMKTVACRTLAMLLMTTTTPTTVICHPLYCREHNPQYRTLRNHPPHSTTRLKGLGVTALPAPCDKTWVLFPRALRLTFLLSWNFSLVTGSSGSGDCDAGKAAIKKQCIPQYWDRLDDIDQPTREQTCW